MKIIMSQKKTIDTFDNRNNYIEYESKGDKNKIDRPKNILIRSGHI